MVRRATEKATGNVMKLRNPLIINNARVAELADALDLGSSGEIRRGSTPLSRTILKSMVYDTKRHSGYLPFLLFLN